LSDNTILNIAKKIQAGGRLDFQDGLALYKVGGLLQLGQLAHEISVSRHGQQIHYCINRHINYTNVCRLKCSFCSFSHRLGQPDSYTMTIEQVVSLARQAQSNGATEVHIVGGLHPDLPFDYYRRMIASLRQECPGLHIKAFSAVEIIDLAQKADISVEAVLAELQAVGLAGLPGGGAEILTDEYFERFCPGKPMPGQWLDVHAAAHKLGLMTNATMLYGYQETPDDHVTHMLKLRQLQDDSLRHLAGAFQSFVPLPFCSADKGTGPDALASLRTIAISRLLLDNIPHIKSFWPMLGINLAQVALCFGANDIDGTVGDYHIVETSSDSDAAPTCLSEKQLRRLIIEAGGIPVCRDGFYRPAKNERS
jgi:aminodeoxyfutalosine synthase